MPAPPFEIHSADVLAPLAAEYLANAVQNAVDRRGVAHIALSGGSTPRALFRLLAEPNWLRHIPWPDMHVWWVDERCVPPDDHESNYGVAYTLLLRHLPVLNVHRMHGETEPTEAARAYEVELRQVFGLGPRARARFDFMLLGMGSDGHVASLFPGTAALDMTRSLVTTGVAPVAPHQRITLTLPVLNRAAFCLFVVAGENKGPALAQIFGTDPGHPSLPAARVRPPRGRLLWLLDHDAANAAGIG